MTTLIFISDSGDDKNDGLSREKPVRSWARALKLKTGNCEFVMSEATLRRITAELLGTGPDDTGKTWEQTQPQGGGLPPGRSR